MSPAPSAPVGQELQQPIASPVGLQLRAIGTSEAFVTLGFLLGAVMLTAFLSALFVTLGFSLPFSTIFPMIGYILGSGASLSVGSGFLSASVGVSFFIMPLTTFVVIVFLTYLIARFRFTHDGLIAQTTPIAVRSLAESAIIALITVLLSFVLNKLGGTTAQILGNLASASLDPRYFLEFFSLVCVLSATLFLTRSHFLGLQWRPAWFIRMCTETVHSTLVFGIVYVAISVLTTLYLSFESGSFLIALAFIVFLPNQVCSLLGLSFLGGIEINLPMSELKNIPMLDGVLKIPREFRSLPEAIHAWDFPYGLGYVLILVALICLLAAALRVGLRRERSSGIHWNRVWQLPVAATTLWFIFAVVLSSIRLSFIGISASVGVSFASVIVVAFAFLGLSILAEVLPMFCAQNALGLLTFVGGRGQYAVWAQSYIPAPVAPTTTTAAMGTTIPQATTVMTPPPPISNISESAPPATPMTETAQVETIPVVSAPSVPAQPPAPAVAPLPVVSLPRTPMSAQKKRKIVLAASVIGVLTVLCVGAVIALNIVNSMRTAEQPVRQYLEAIAKGDAETALSIADPGIRNDERVLLTNDVLAHSSAHIEIVNIHVENAAASNETSQHVTATLALDGEQFTQFFEAQPGPKEFGLLRTWKLKAPELKRIDIRAEGFSEVLIGGTTVKARKNLSLPLFPGIYTVSGVANDYIQSDEKTLRVLDAFSKDDYVSIEPKATESFEKLLLEKANELVKSCSTVGGNLDERCPYRVQSKNLSTLELGSLAKKIADIDFSMGRFESSEADIITRYSSSSSDQHNRFRVVGTFDLSNPTKPEITITDAF
ncbi:hypothetical protein [Schaalia sp. lx-260]|uniref:hypothetical protein n=1 Tax=Schaalia sp. lx-260 TaxID=2899082 RepID=UPI001E5ECFA1|nr:hypothetical protein [Schaalia sp. lx-260]MCD4549388.1 hypothetical protein [Schaalia sp. lx-260]